MADATKPENSIDPEPENSIDPEVKKKAIEGELKIYEAHGQVFTQITALYTLMLSIVGLYVLISAGTWAYVASGAAGKLALAAAAIFHLLVSAVAIGICFGITSTILQRFKFLELLGEHLPEFMEIGNKASRAIGGSKFAIRWQTRIWSVIPVIGALAGLVLFATILASAPSRPGVCGERLRAVEAAASRVDLDRAIFLYREAGCVSSVATDVRAATREQFESLGAKTNERLAG